MRNEVVDIIAATRYIQLFFVSEYCTSEANRHRFDVRTDNRPSLLGTRCGLTMPMVETIFLRRSDVTCVFESRNDGHTSVFTRRVLRVHAM